MPFLSPLPLLPSLGQKPALGEFNEFKIFVSLGAPWALPYLEPATLQGETCHARLLRRY